MATVVTPPLEQRVLLNNVSWQSYENLLKELEGQRLRLTYDRGSLEIMTIAHSHDNYGRLLGAFVRLSAGNVIANNGNDGVGVDATCINDGILSNSISSDGFLGIDLNDDGVTANHPPLQQGAGANFSQDYPVFTAQNNASSTQVTGTITGLANTRYLVQLFSDTVANPSGYGEGRNLVDSVSMTTDSSGTFNFAISTSPALSASSFLAATETDPSNDTSEFSQCQPVQAAPGRPPARTTDLTRNLVDLEQAPGDPGNINMPSPKLVDRRLELPDRSHSPGVDGFAAINQPDKASAIPSVHQARLDDFFADLARLQTSEDLWGVYSR
jgi:hypothetical protein